MVYNNSQFGAKSLKCTYCNSTAQLLNCIQDIPQKASSSWRNLVPLSSISYYTSVAAECQKGLVGRFSWIEPGQMYLVVSIKSCAKLNSCQLWSHCQHRDLKVASSICNQVFSQMCNYSTQYVFYLCFCPRGHLTWIIFVSSGDSQETRGFFFGKNSQETL